MSNHRQLTYVLKDAINAVLTNDSVLCCSLKNLQISHLNHITYDTLSKCLYNTRRNICPIIDRRMFLSFATMIIDIIVKGLPHMSISYLVKLL